MPLAVLACAALAGCDGPRREVDSFTLDRALQARFARGGLMVCQFTSVGKQIAINKETVAVQFEASCTVTSKYLDPATTTIKDEFVFRYAKGTPGFFGGTPASWSLLPR